MAIPTIHVHTRVDKSTAPYARFMWETMNLLANHPELPKITVRCAWARRRRRGQRRGSIRRGNTTIISGRKGDPLRGSCGHGACVASALP